MKRQTASQDGWIRISTRDGRTTVSGQPRFFKGYALDDGDGVFVEWDWDGHRFTARTCHTGFLPLYYNSDGEQLAVSTRVADIFAATGSAPRLCPASLGVLLRLGFMVGDHTPFSGVKVLGPQGTIEWTPGAQPTIRSTYPDQGQSCPQDAAARYTALFREAAHRICAAMPGDFAMPLSGGRDSRHIAIELHRQGRKPRFVLTAEHLPPRTNEDVRVASALCRAMDWPHRVVRQPVRAGFRQELDHAQAVDYMTYEHAWTLPVRDILRASGVGQVFDGVGGDVLSAGLFQDDRLLQPYLDGAIHKVRDGLLRSWSQLGGDDALRDSLGNGLAELADPAPAVALIDAELRLHLGRPNPLKSFYFWNRSRRATGLLPFKILGNQVVYAPYLDKDLLSYLLGLPPAATADRTLHDRAIALANPALGAIPYEDKQAAATRPAISDRVGFYGPLMTSTLASKRYLNRRFLLPRAAQALLLGGDLQSIWWKPRRVAYLAGLHQFMQTNTTEGNHAANDR